VHSARHHNRVVPRDELLDAVWGHRFVTDATLVSRIKAARRAIGASGAEQPFPARACSYRRSALAGVLFDARHASVQLGVPQHQRVCDPVQRSSCGG
jgi:hypothetical protein